MLDPKSFRAQLIREQITTLKRYDEMPERGFGFDTETHLIQPGLLSPPLVIGSAAEWDRVAGKARGVLLSKQDTLETWIAALKSNVIIIGANLAFDVLVMTVHAAKLGLDILALVFDKYERGEMYDLQIAESLNAIADGTLGRDPETGGRLVDPATGKQGRYSLSIVTHLVLGRGNAKVNDAWRASYALLEHVPIELWPLEARIYPVDDAVNALEIALAQTGHIEIPGPHMWPVGPGTDGQHCAICGCHVMDASKTVCQPRRWRHRNLHDLPAQSYTHFAMHLGASWGFNVDQAAVDALEAEVMAGQEEREQPFFDAGILRWKKEKGKLKPSKNTAVLKKMIATAYGCTGTCKFCHGGGKVASPKAKAKRCKGCNASGLVPDVRGPQLCEVCKGLGTVPDKMINCVPCGATGYDLDSAAVPRTDGSKCKPCGNTGMRNGEACEECDGNGIIQGVGTGRDVLMESGDELLMNFAASLEKKKIVETYIPWLREARVNIGSAEDPLWRGVPLCLRPNVLLETGRTSYDGVVQQLPRKGGVRECIVARPGYVFCSVDYESGELITHAQSCLWIVGYSKLAEALNRKIKVHNAFAASILGLTYDDFQQRFKNKDLRCKDTRQATKPANFGFPGRMGGVTLVLQQRKQGPDTPCEQGSTWIEDENGNKVRGYKGLRFCVLMDNAPRCGDVKVTEWNRRSIPPTCKHCIECAERLRKQWLEQWPENVDYFEFVSYCEENGQPLTPEQRELFGVECLAPGEIVQHVSNRIRGGRMGADSIGNAISNGWFQGLLADITKSWLRRAIREMYDPSFRMPNGERSPLYGSRFILFAHDELIAELLEATAHEAAHRLSDIAVEEMIKYCPDMKKAANAEPALARRWYKAMESVYHFGRLVPWEPGHNPKSCELCKASTAAGWDGRYKKAPAGSAPPAPM